MTSIASGIPINGANVRPLDMSGLKRFKVSEADEETYRRYVEAQERMLEFRHSSAPDLSGNPAYRDYATIQVGGRTVARIDNNGFVQSSNALGGKLRKLFAEEDDGLSGPALAQQRAEKIAGLLGGTVVGSATALGQSEYSAVTKPGRTVDEAALREDPSYEQLLKTKEARTLFLAQQIGQETAGEPVQQTAPAAETDETSERSDAVEDFLDYMSKTPEERYLEALLKEKGLTREEFEALPPDEQAKIMAELTEKMRQKAEQKVSEPVV